ncbi:hypothetical protein F2Q70_00021933 [Brassica cretica]|uniref:Uncharacterized protein n=1 Tax=Brassica cretica TaxID=69181 RepID=A0A8S9HF86_BRACR|nr:hypothetical protein F2Q70_00021933 [Brassica cretica]KAF2555720.1 hypothetical protein F2Q68_00015710 [Brassica cretica]
MNNQSQEPKNQAEPKLKVFVADDRKVSSENENVNAGKPTEINPSDDHCFGETPLNLLLGIGGSVQTTRSVG